MRVLNASPGSDTGGYAARLEAAFAKHSRDIEYRAIAANVNYIQYDTAVRYIKQPRQRQEYRAAWTDADVVHLNNNPYLGAQLGAPGRPMVYMHHGGEFREHSQDYLPLIRAGKAPGVVSTLDLWLLAPDDLVWVGCPYDHEELAAKRVSTDDGVLRIAHAPTNRAIKSTDALLAAVERLRRDVPVALILIEQMSWRDCLERKAYADIYFDQTLLGYGNNAVEAWGMGIPVVAGAAGPTLQEMERRFGSLPFVLADEGSIYQALLHLAEPTNRARWAKRGREHVGRFHSEQGAVEQMSAIYRQAL